MESLNKEDGDFGIARYSATKELLLDYIKAESGRLCCEKIKTELDI